MAQEPKLSGTVGARRVEVRMIRETLIEDCHELLEGALSIAALDRLESERDDLAEARTIIQNALGNGADEELWHCGESWAEAACRAIEFFENYRNA